MVFLHFLKNPPGSRALFRSNIYWRGAVKQIYNAIRGREWVLELSLLLYNLTGAEWSVWNGSSVLYGESVLGEGLIGKRIFQAAGRLPFCVCFLLMRSPQRKLRFGVCFRGGINTDGKIKVSTWAFPRIYKKNKQTKGLKGIPAKARLLILNERLKS